MGKRKERRLAAKASGRRVKLDIFAEPPGDSGGSSAQDELGGNIDPRHRAGSADSPSSSGKLENPLSLLGQYSDEESDGDSSKRLGHKDNSSDVDHDQVRQGEEAESDHTKSNPTIDIDADKEKQDGLKEIRNSPDASHEVENVEYRAIDPTGSGDLGNEVTVETSVGATGLQTSGEEFSCWKVVLHEESNQHYYWNTLTGETSWVVPDVLAQGNELTGEQGTILLTEGGSIILDGENHSTSILNGEGDISNTIHATEDFKSGNVLHGTQEISQTVTQVEQDNMSRGEGRGLDSPGKQTALKDSYGAGQPHFDSLSSLESANAVHGNSNATGAGSEKYNEEHGLDVDLCSSALKYGESLMERLKALKGSKTNVEGADWIYKYILEVEIRLSDIKSLLPFGSSLLPFWVHCERQLKELEDALDIQVSQLSKTAGRCETEELHKLQDLEDGEIESDGTETNAVCEASVDAITSMPVQEFSKNEDIGSGILHAQHVSEVGHETSKSVDGTGEGSGGYEAQLPTVSTADAVVHTGEDVDMDVDMEVEEQVLTNTTITNDPLNAEEQPPLPNPSPESGYFMPPESFGVPPPPEDYFIPPPPPDDELVPPLPPDDPPELSYPPPPAYSETVQSLSYADGYSLNYSGSSFDYYGQANPVYSANTVYGLVDGSQVAGPAPPLYCESLPSMYTGAAPATINPIDSSAYYNAQNGAVLPVPVASVSQSLVLPVESPHEVVANQITSVDSHTEVCVPATHVTEKPSTVGSTQAPSSVSAVENVWSSATSGVTSAPIVSNSTGSTAQPKVSRSKKRTVAGATLKSNKKVSSLVNKWKAVKEELHEEDEDEPENDYDFLEKKRQREIEEWRAKQIATGEARDNANFQPLGGDWRERVKRKRARMNSEPVETSPATSTDVTQEPDLKEFSRDLPSGWQAFWDESSKQVYYGNTLTSETTWTRPAK